MPDIYFLPGYGKVYERIENGELEVFTYEDADGLITHQFIRRESASHEGQRYYELLTPYGYGGPVIRKCREGRKDRLTASFHKAFSAYCSQNRIVSEFIRFHPVFSNALDFSQMYELELRRMTTGTNLAAFEDPVKHEFSKSKQRSVQKALDAGVTYRITCNPPDLSQFAEMYNGTMQRKQAEDIYRFDDWYFRSLQNEIGEHLLLVEILFEEQVIGAGLVLRYGDLLHLHLSGTREGSHHLQPGVVMRYALVTWGKANGYRLVHEGGGTTGNPDDPLYLYKRQFSKNTEFPYYVSYKIWDKELYSKFSHDEMECEEDPDSNSQSTSTQMQSVPAYD